jgi:hypothetical protein
LLLLFYSTFGQENFLNNYKYHIDLAEKLNRTYRFDESIVKLQKAIIITKNNKEHQILSAEISLAELIRRTKNYIKGYEVLTSPKKI